MDASNIGFIGYLRNLYFSGLWPKTWKTYHITIKGVISQCTCSSALGRSVSLVDTRLPLTPIILKQLIASLQYTTSLYFAQVLMKSVYLVAFSLFS